MKQVGKCFVSFLLALTMTFGVVPCVASAGPANENTPPSKPTGLQMELMEKPFGICNANPSMSWIVNDADKDELQTAYQILVASSSAKIGADEGDVWDSGKIVSAESSNVRYAGPTLTADTTYYWKVRTWDKSDEVSPYSQEQRFSTAIDSWSANALWVGKPSATDDNASSGVTLFERMGWKNYDIECKFGITTTALGFCFYMDNSDKNYYMWQVNAKDSKVKAHWFVNGGISASNVHGLANIAIDLSTEHTMKLSVRDSVVTMYIDNTLISTADMKELGYTVLNGGTFGFRTGVTESGWVDDLKITNEYGVVLYQNDFSASCDDFTNVMTNVVSVSNGTLVIPKDSRSYYQVKDDILLNKGWKDYDFECDFGVTAVALGFSFYTANSTKPQDTAGNRYMWQINAKNQLRPHVYKTGSAITALDTVDLGSGVKVAADGASHKVKISVRGTTITTYVDGVLVDTRTADAHTYGTIGFRTGVSEAGWVDNIKVSNKYGSVIFEANFDDGSNPFSAGSVESGRLIIPRGSDAANSVSYFVEEYECDIETAPEPRENVFFVRKDFDIPEGKTVDSAVLSITALASSRTPRDPLSAHQWTYKSYVNGRFSGMGPHMDTVGGKYFYNCFDVTDLVVNGGNTVGAIVYAMKDQRFQAQLKITYTDGTSQLIASDETWMTLNGTEAYGEGEASIGTHLYTAMAENIDAREFPYGWNKYGFDASEWYAPAVKDKVTNLTPSPMDPMCENEVDIAKIVDKGNGNYFIDLGKEIIGGLRLTLNKSGVADSEITVLYGEELSAENTVRWKMRAGNQYKELWTLKDGEQTFEHFGMKTFRYVELQNVPTAITAEDIENGLKGVAIHMAFDENESYFVSDNQILNDIYELCKYTLKVTTQDLYVDSQSRERNVFEGDAYINQLSHYSFSRNYTASRFTNEFLTEHPTGCTDYSQINIMRFLEEYLYTGNTESISAYYNKLCDILLDELYDATYKMVNTGGKGDLVDWPTSLLDGFLVGGNNYYNIAVNALVYRAAMDLASIADVLENNADAEKYTAFAESIREGIMALYDELGRFYEGRGADGSILTEENPSQHASFFPLSLGVVTDSDKIASISEFLESEGIECSVYGVQFLLTAMYAADNAQAALDMMLSTEMESWYHMIYELNATVTAECWDPSYKGNMTFSHAWGSAPGNVIVRNLCGIMPLEAGYGKAQIKPAIGNLKNVSVKVPNIKGYIYMDIDTANSAYITDMAVTLPTNTTAKVYVPAGDYVGKYVIVDGKAVAAEREGNYLVIDNVGSGEHTFRVTYSAPHAGYAFDSFSGRFICTDCGAHCEHTSFTEDKCNLCGFVCVHDWEDDGVNAVCSVCGKTCTSQEIPKLDYSCATCENNSAYLDGVCAECGTECNHVFNAGGHCTICGEFGNAITFADGQNGGGNINDTESNGDALTDGDGIYCSQSGSYKQLWDYRDESGSLLGRSYVFSGVFNFSDVQYVSENDSGTTRLLIWADGDVTDSTTKFALYLLEDNGKLKISPDENDVSTRMSLELNKDYDIRVAVRSTDTSEGTYSNVADIIIDGKLIWTKSFTLTSENGMAIRIGDHTDRQTRVKYDIAKDFGIHCLDSEINFIGTQQKEDANYELDTKYDLRFIFALDALYLNDVGIKVEAEMSGGEKYDAASGTLTASSSRTVLNGVMANGEVRKPGAYGAGYGGYYLALAITDIPLDTSATYTFTLTPYVTHHGGETVFSEASHTVKVNFVDGEMNINYEIAD